MTSLEGVRITYLEQPGDHSFSPAFEITLTGSGFVTLRCLHHCAASGEVTEPIDKTRVADLVSAIRASGFFGLPRVGDTKPNSHGGGERLTYRDDQRVHEVVSARTRVPELVTRVREAIDVDFWLTPSVEMYGRRLGRGWNVNAVDEYQQSALSNAVRACDSAAVKFLLDRGARVDGALAMVSGCADSDVAVAAELVRAHRVQGVPFPTDALVSAADRRTATVIRLLLDAGMAVDAHGHDGVTASMRAAQRGHYEILELLLSRGANPNAVDASGRSALSIAATSFNTGGVTLLARRGANINATDASGRTALIDAAANCRYWIVEALLAAGADPTIKDRQGRTAADVGLAPTDGNFDKCGPTKERLSRTRP